VHKRVIVIDASEGRNELLVLSTRKSSAGKAPSTRGRLLSVPGIYEPVERAERVTVRALDLDGKPFTLVADKLPAICIQHEMDHLEGKVFVDYLSRLKQQRIKAKLQKTIPAKPPEAAFDKLSERLLSRKP